MNKIDKIVNQDKLALSTLIVFVKSHHSVYQREMKTIRESGLTVSQFAVLEALYTYKELTINEIIQKNLSTSGNMTVVIRNLEKCGLVERKVNFKDNRSALITLTQKGQNKIESILPKHYSNVIEIMNVLTDEEKQLLKQLLKKLSGVK